MAAIEPSQAEFLALAKTYNVIPVYTEIATDIETPVSVYTKLVGEDIGFMLESAETGKSFGRYSFIGTQPFAILRAKAQETEIELAETIRCETGTPLSVVRRFLASYQAAPLIDLPMVSGGVVGYFAYDIISTFERVRGHVIPADMLLSELMFCRNLVVMDHLTHTSRMVSLAQLKPGQEPLAAYQEAVAELARMKERLQQPATMPVHDKPAAPVTINSNVSKEAFMEMVETAKEHIRAGDIFQVVLSQRLTTELGDHPFNLYRKLRRVNPSSYMFYINFGEKKLVGSSPEILVKLQDGHVTNRPIAGSRPRGADSEEDSRLAAELLADTKECAEHTMLVDLGRNDLGRVCVPGTVAVERYMQVEMFSHVMHIVSEVGGTIRPDFGAVDALEACFPAGTLSGAPKVRAMEIINELENVSRGTYGGAIGYLDFTGNMDTCIAIRTMDISGNTVSVQAGAGLVYDSVPVREYEETLHKAGALLKVIKGEGAAAL